jgi:type IV pilus assembly protein PilP
MSRAARAALLALCAVLGACGPGLSDLQDYVAQVKARKTTQIEPIPQMKPYEPFAYVAGERRDPFVPMQSERDRNAQAAAGGGVRPDLTRNKEALEDFPLDALQMVGVVSYQNVLYALVKAPDAVIHRVTAGNHMGQNFGRIDKISENQISLTEIVPDGFGGYSERPASLALAEK